MGHFEASVAQRASLAVSSLIRLSQTCVINCLVFHLVFDHLFHRRLHASWILQTSGGISRPAQGACALQKSHQVSPAKEMYRVPSPNRIAKENCQIPTNIVPQTQCSYSYNYSDYTDCTWIRSTDQDMENGKSQKPLAEPNKASAINKCSTLDPGTKYTKRIKRPRGKPSVLLRHSHASWCCRAQMEGTKFWTRTSHTLLSALCFPLLRVCSISFGHWQNTLTRSA